MAEIEKKISEAINFVILFFRSLGYFIFPWLIVRKIKSTTEVFPPLAFLAILSFFGLKLWTYLFLSIDTQHENISLSSSTDATLTQAKKLDINEFLSIPGIEEIFTLTIPYIFLVVILSKIVRRIFKKKTPNQETDLGDIIVYFCGFLVILFPLIFLIKDLPWFSDTGSLKALLLLAIPPYLYIMFASALPKSVSPFRRIRFGIVLSIIVPLFTLSFVFGSIYLSTHVRAFENGDLKASNANQYLQTELFEATVINRSQIDKNNLYWKALLRTTDVNAGEFIPCYHNLEGLIYGVRRYNGDSTTRHNLCFIKELQTSTLHARSENYLDSSYHERNGVSFSNETCIVYALTSSLMDSGYFSDLYAKMNVLHAQSVSTESVVIKLWSSTEGLNSPIGKMATLGKLLLKPRSIARQNVR